MNSAFACSRRLHAVGLVVFSVLLSACVSGGSTAPNETSSTILGSQSTEPLGIPTPSASSEPAAQTARPTNLPSDIAEPTLTPLPLFGQKVERPVLFERAQESVLTGEDIHTLGKPADGASPGEVEELLGFIPLQVSPLPSGYSLEGLEIFASEGTVRQCATRSGSGSTGLPRICTLQRASPLSDPIGMDATAFQLETADLYIEYVYGGWLGVGNFWDPVSSYRWDDRMVPVLQIRFEKDGLYVEVSCVGGECPELGELIRSIEKMSSP